MGRWEATDGWSGLRAGVVALVAASSVFVGACGEDDFPNEPRPASPVALTAAIDKSNVSISPQELGAGLVVITISNQTGEATRFTLEGPTTAASGDIVPGGTATLKTDLAEGEYEATAEGDGIEPSVLEVGPPRPSSQNDLLLP